MKDRNDQNGFKYNEKNIRMPHKLHLDAGAKCAICHKDIAHDLRQPQTNRPRMDYCFQCHPSTDKCDKCHPGGPPKEETYIPPPPLVPEKPSEKEAAQAAFETQCSKCHALYPAAKYTKGEWPAVVQRMVAMTGAGISAQDKALIISYFNENAP